MVFLVPFSGYQINFRQGESWWKVSLIRDDFEIGLSASDHLRVPIYDVVVNAETVRGTLCERASIIVF